jgi:hypothetical protein
LLFDIYKETEGTKIKTIAIATALAISSSCAFAAGGGAAGSAGGGAAGGTTAGVDEDAITGQLH